MKRIIFFCLALLSFQLASSQTPVAGLDSTNAVVSMGGFVGEFGLNVPNTSTGSITSWHYVATDLWGAPIANLTLNGPHANFFMNLSPQGSAVDMLLKQVVTGPGGSDSLTVRLQVNCQVVTPAIQYWLTTTSNLPEMTFCTATTDNAFGRDVFVNGPFLVSSGWHAQTGCGTDTFSLPGPAYVCGQFWDCTCCGLMRVVCDTFNIPCWRNPVVGFTSSVSSQQVQFQSNVIATAGALYAWDFGDGQSANGTSPNHFYTNSGAYTVCLTVIDTCGATTVCDTVNVVATSMMEQNLTAFSCLPNPSHGLFEVGFDREFGDHYRLTVSDLRGVALYEDAWTAGAGNVRRPVDLSMAAGMYLLTIESGSGVRLVRRIQVE